MYRDFYGNYGIVIILSKKDITYQNFCMQILSLKKYLRARFEFPYISYVFDTSEIGEKNEHQKLMIVSPDGTEVPKNAMNQEGTFMVFFTNEIHSPDEKVESSIQELQILQTMGLFTPENLIPKVTVENMRRYKTFEFLQDM